MKGPIRILFVVTLLLLQQAVTPLLGSAYQDLDPAPVESEKKDDDPCEEEEDPSPDATPTPTPSPSPSPDPDDEDAEEEEECEEQDDGKGGDGDDGGSLDPSPDPCGPDSVPGCKDIEPDGGGKGGGGKDGGGKDGGGNGGGGQGGGGGGAGKGDADASKTSEGGQKGDRGGDAEYDSPEFFLGGPENTSRLIKILTELTQYGVPLRESLMEVVGPFPVAGLAWWTNDWHACRDGCSRKHKGLDIFAKEGTPLVAAADGVISQKGTGDLAGLYIEITDADGVEYFYAHLSDWAEGIEMGDEVEMGDVVGYVGNTGNAITTPPHLHFEYQPDGIPVAPKPLVDRWLRIAERRALELVGSYEGEEPIELADLDTFRLARLFDLGGQGPAGQGSSSELLILAGLQPAASSFEMARRTLDRMAWEIDWSAQIDAELAALIKEYERAAAEERLLGGPLLATRPDGPQDELEGLAELGD